VDPGGGHFHPEDSQRGATRSGAESLRARGARRGAAARRRRRRCSRRPRAGGGVPLARHGRSPGGPVTATASSAADLLVAKTQDPDVSYVLAATNAIKQALRRGQLIVLESTTYPGTTRELMLPALVETGLKVGADFFLAFSPERVDPGNGKWNTHNTPKV